MFAKLGKLPPLAFWFQEGGSETPRSRRPVVRNQIKHPELTITVAWEEAEHNICPGNLNPPELLGGQISIPKVQAKECDRLKSLLAEAGALRALNLARAGARTRAKESASPVGCWKVWL